MVFTPLVARILVPAWTNPNRTALKIALLSSLPRVNIRGVCLKICRQAMASRLWEEPAPSCAHPTQEKWQQALAQARDFVEAEDNKKFGYPDATSVITVQQAVIIYAWNEFAEGRIRRQLMGGVTSLRKKEAERLTLEPCLQ
jgi:hypothetical protein